ncbi:MAG TPA: sulfite exporter TauE/SafE family protein [Nevskia sp.]|nr:sulfite exporter TauE/SafE family protein [Nevskia sp.]
MLISSLLGALVGLVLGLTGAGGGILAVPALVFGMGWTMQQAAPVALIAVSGGAAIGAIEGFRRRLVRWRAALLMAAAGIPCTVPGIRLAHQLSQQWLYLAFCGVLVIAALRLLHACRQVEERRAETAMSGLARIDQKTGRIRWTWPSVFLVAGIGAVSGFMTGLLGVGGGFVIVPLLRRYTGVSMHGIVATSLLVIAVVGSGGVAVALLHGAHPPLEATAWFTAATAAGMLLGRQLAARLSARQVQAGFAVLLLGVALMMGLRGLGLG